MQASGIGHWGVADVNLQDAEPGLLQWLEAGFHGEMDYMARHGLKSGYRDSRSSCDRLAATNGLGSRVARRAGLAFAGLHPRHS
ncbi:MAG: hypothetical protein EB114_10150 [Betaproteobacteria bacterium]|nr:hypothetical protein [Betaproteobacteria bacterium]